MANLVVGLMNSALRFSAGWSLPWWNPRHIPSGNNTGVETRYFNYLWQVYLHSGQHQEVNIQWSDEMLIVIWTVVLALLAYLLTNGAYQEQNKRGAATDPSGPLIQDLYPVEAYNGVITERNGAVDYFNWTLYAIVLAWGLGIMIFQIIFGQVY